MQIVDAHHHFWDLSRNYYPWLCDEPLIPFRYGDYSSIRKSFMPRDYFEAAGEHQVVKTVTMEGEWDPNDPVGESHWMEGVAAAHGFPQAHVAQAWLDAEDIDNVLATQANMGLVRSVRHKPYAAASYAAIVSGHPGSMGDPKWRAGYALLEQYGLHFDLQTPWWHLYEAAELAGDFPDTTMILNHTGLPADRSETGLSGWHQAMGTLAELSNVVVKISGLGLPGKRWHVDDNGPIIRATIDIFGIDRCMFASNFPVDGLVADLDSLISGYREALADLPAEDQNKFFHDNAVRIYGL
jgi:predicted TIM-barrel fold metal-dependent hydrolase